MLTSGGDMFSSCKTKLSGSKFTIAQLHLTTFVTLPDILPFNVNLSDEQLPIQPETKTIFTGEYDSDSQMTNLLTCYTAISSSIYERCAAALDTQR